MFKETRGGRPGALTRADRRAKRNAVGHGRGIHATKRRLWNRDVMVHGSSPVCCEHGIRRVRRNRRKRAAYIRVPNDVQNLPKLAGEYLLPGFWENVQFGQNGVEENARFGRHGVKGKRCEAQQRGQRACPDGAKDAPPDAPLMMCALGRNGLHGDPYKTRLFPHSCAYPGALVLTGNEVPGNRLRVRVSCPPLV